MNTGTLSPQLNLHADLSYPAAELDGNARCGHEGGSPEEDISCQLDRNEAPSEVNHAGTRNLYPPELPTPLENLLLAGLANCN